MHGAKIRIKKITWALLCYKLQAMEDSQHFKLVFVAITRVGDEIINFYFENINFDTVCLFSSVLFPKFHTYF